MSVNDKDVPVQYIKAEVMLWGPREQGQGYACPVY